MAQVGDWGRLGRYNQSAVAALMGRKAALEQPDFIISTGDNFYESAPVRRLCWPGTWEALSCHDHRGCCCKARQW